MSGGGNDAMVAKSPVEADPVPEGDEGSRPYVFAKKRYDALEAVLKRANKGLITLQTGHRIHTEFERELEWLATATKIFYMRKEERHRFLYKFVDGTEKGNDDPMPATKKRSLDRLIQTVHRETPTIMVCHRTYG